MLTGVLRQSSGRAQFIAQFICALEIDGSRFTSVVENDDPVRFEMPGARDLNVADVMLPHPRKYCLLDLDFGVDMLIAKKV